LASCAKFNAFYNKSVFSNLPAHALSQLLKRTAISTILVGAVAFVVAILWFPPWSALGVVIGLALAIANLRLLDTQAARVELKGPQSEKAVRRQIGGKTAGRLFLVTLVVIGALLLEAPLGIGIVSGLVLYQIVFVLNVLRVVSGQGGLE
jgi:hypothetical protein